MAKYLIWLLLLGTSNALANYCYWNGSRYNSDCYACLPNSGWPEWWKQQYCGATTTCTPRVETQTLQCQSGFTGSITQSRNITCANPYQEVVNQWYTTSNTCTPICQTETQVTQESCPQGYTGQITKTRTKSCPQNIWTETTQNTCVKSLTNPTNVTSPVSPVSPINPTSPTAAPVSPTPTSTVTATTPADVQNSVTTQTTPPTSQTKSTASETPTPKLNVKTLPLALSLELFSKPFTQPNVFPDLNISQELPNDIKILQQTYMDLITNGSLFNPDQTEKLNSIARDAVELEQ